MKGYMHSHNKCPGIDEEDIRQYSIKYKSRRVQSGHAMPLGDGILIWDETKV